MRQLGFSFHEVMSGTYTRVAPGTGGGAIKFTAKVTADSALKHLRDNMARLEGTLDMEDFAMDVPIRGTILISPLIKRIIRYEFNFLGDDGNPYRFAGQKDVRLSALKSTMTTLSGTISDTSGKEVARATVKFDIDSDLLPFLLSFQPALA